MELELELKIPEMELELNWKNGSDPNPGGGVIICHKKEIVIDEIDIIEEKPGETTHHDEIV